MINWSRYLESLCNAYAQWWQVYTITDVVGQKPVEAEPSPFLFDFGLMVQTLERDREERGKGEETIERLTVLEGLRKYASEHVLLVGRPGIEFRHQLIQEYYTAESLLKLLPSFAIKNVETRIML